MKDKLIIKILSLSKYVIRIDEFDPYFDGCFENMKMYYIRLKNNRTLPFCSKKKNLCFRGIIPLLKIIAKEGVKE